jgi:UDP-2,3-diacylglucosamine pyrophosphatase LpxH
LSDVHLGCRYSQAENLLGFLNCIEADRIYIVGDFIDGWRLKRRWHWQGVYVKILQRLVALASQGTQIFYAPGNHDEFLRDYLHDFGLVTVSNQFIHQTTDGRRFAVLHGDQFDNIERRARWLSIVGARAYDALVCTNGLVNWLRRRLGLENCRFSTHVKIWAKQAVQFISDFEERLICYAKEQECDGVICGHIHVPRIDRCDDVLYCNTGDWVEHRTALVEYQSGELELIEWSDERCQSIARDPLWRPFADDIRESQPAAEQLAASILVELSEAIETRESARPANVAGLIL